MKKLILFLIALFLITGCSSDDSNNDNAPGDSAFTIQLQPSDTNIVIDQAFTITVNANEKMQEMWVSLNNFATGGLGLAKKGIFCIAMMNHLIYI